MVGCVVMLHCAPGTILVGPTHTVLPTLAWEATSPRIQLCNPSGAAGGSTQPLAHWNLQDVTQPGQLLYFIISSQ